MKAIIWDFSGTICDTQKKVLYKGAKEILKKASKRYRQALVTTKLSDPEGRTQLIKDLGIWEYFEIVKISLKTKDIFLEICKEFDCKPEETLVIGDGYRYGPYPKEILTGNKLKMKTIWVDFRNTSKLKEKLLGIRYWKKITTLSELDNIL
jgi:FMN phosphatase YigB (HAD superfamily)